MRKFWNVFRWFLLAFFIYAILNSPESAAAILKTIFQLLKDAIAGIGRLFDVLLSKA